MECLALDHIKAHQVQDFRNPNQKLEKKQDSKASLTIFLDQEPMKKKKISHIQTAIFLEKKTVQKIDDLPGPGNYEPDYKKIIKINSGYKIGSEKKSDPPKNNVNFPGPGQYDTDKSTLVNESRAVQFDPSSRKLKIGNNATITPGPNEYSEIGFNSTVRNEPKISFAKSKRILSMKNFVPAPNNYDIKTQFEEAKNQNKGFSLRPRTEIKKDAFYKDLPGPGAYQSNAFETIKKNHPSFSMKKQDKLKILRLKQIQDAPGPNSYQPKITALQHRSFKIGKYKRSKFESKQNFPGPGNYDVKIMKKYPQFSVGKAKRKGIVEAEKDKPGPGQYEPKIVVNSQYETIKMGKRFGETFEGGKNIPGPGTYTSIQNQYKGGKSFGNQKKLPQLKESCIKNPGPGSYHIPSTLSNLAEYTKVKNK